jgi:hypothetical protein
MREEAKRAAVEFPLLFLSTCLLRSGNPQAHA